MALQHLYTLSSSHASVAIYYIIWIGWLRTGGKMGSVWLTYPVSLPSRLNLSAKRYPKRRGLATVAAAQMPNMFSGGMGPNIQLIAIPYDQAAASVQSVLGEEVLNKWEQALEILQAAFLPAPNSSAEGGDSTEFLLTSALLLVVFWLGNYVVPDWIFRKTVFRKTDETDETDEMVGDDLFGSLIRERGNGKNSPSEGSKSSRLSDSDVEASTSNINKEYKSVGFGTKIKSKHNRSRS